MIGKKWYRAHLVISNWPIGSKWYRAHLILSNWPVGSNWYQAHLIISNWAIGNNWYIKVYPSFSITLSVIGSKRWEDVLNHPTNIK